MKAVRNTIFTVVVLLLTGIGLQWHNSVVKSIGLMNPPAVVLASQHLGEANPDFPVQINFNSPQVRLGQAETITVHTLANANLEVVTQYPDGTVNHPETFRANADKSGQYTFNLTIDDYHYLGVFRLSVVASVDTKTAESIGQFQVTSWQPPASDSADGYTFPLVP